MPTLFASHSHTHIHIVRGPLSLPPKAAPWLPFLFRKQFLLCMCSRLFVFVCVLCVKLIKVVTWRRCRRFCCCKRVFLLTHTHTHTNVLGPLSCLSRSVVAFHPFAQKFFSFYVIGFLLVLVAVVIVVVVVLLLHGIALPLFQLTPLWLLLLSV